MLGPGQYAIREVSSGRYCSPRVAYDLSAIELSANRAVWEVLSVDGLSATSVSYTSSPYQDDISSGDTGFAWPTAI
jgi:hypothetical protein